MSIFVILAMNIIVTDFSELRCDSTVQLNLFHQKRYYDYAFYDKT